ncbi:uncharacterized protein LOC135838819 [Planococcus citri]|uniref:uncharacterized protein LOC135838819 n=1 Tax=Planococcus citri TaxID=170843 RepID=UPI0031F767A6
MNLNCMPFLFHIVFTFHGVFAFVNNSPAEVNRRVEEEYRYRRCSNRELLFNNFDYFYNLRTKKTDDINRYQPLLFDNVLFQNLYSAESHPSFNPVHFFELQNAEFYFESSGSAPKTREQIFTDFFIKYHAAFAFLHFWVTRFVIQHTIPIIPEASKHTAPGSFLKKCDEMLFYAYWMVNLGIDRHLDELDSKLLVVSKNRSFHKVIPAFENIVKTLRAMIEVEPLSSSFRQEIFELTQKSNPFNLRLKRVEVGKQNWMRIIHHVENNLKENAFALPEIFFKDVYEDFPKTISTHHLKDPTKYMKYLHYYSWSAIKVVLGRELHIMESFFYSTLTGVPYPLGDFFIKPDFSFTKKLWRRLECYYSFWNPFSMIKPNELDDDHSCEDFDKDYYLKNAERSNRIYLIKILREIDNLRFNLSSKHHFTAVDAKFTLKTCMECFFRCWCYGGFRMVDGKKMKSNVNE